MKIVIGEGLVRATLSPEKQFLGIPANLGAREIGRLMGRGKHYGDGPLPVLIRSAASKETEPHLILLREEAESNETDSADSPGVDVMGEWVEPIEAVTGQAAVVVCPPGQLASRELVTAIAEASGADVDEIERGAVDISFLVVGCNTEQRVQAVAIFLRTVLGFDRVAICPHLVGSATSEAHFASLRHGLPQAGVDVMLDLWEAARWIGLDPEAEELPRHPPCEIHPPETRARLSHDARRIIELICLHWTRTELRALAGGFSGSLLFLADGWKGEARTEPMVLKIDAFGQMRRELDGYHQVKDFFGKHVPTFGYPVTEGDQLGLGMELAAMEGRPTTLQDHFEEAEDEASTKHFLVRLDKALTLLTGKLYGNTLEGAPVAPFRAFGLHASQQLEWLRENGLVILDYMAELGGPEDAVDLDYLLSVVRLVVRNEDSLDSEVCVQHGDLNYANVICDDGDNTWFIDWTHSGTYPVELDFAKLESDTKFVMSKAFDIEDLPHLQQLEEYLLTHRIPAPADELPDELKFAKWDLRFRKIISAVRLIRQRLFDLKEGDDWVVYRAALLRYALHTLSFDLRREQGECTEVQLMHALYSCETIALELVADDFHLKIRAERPSSYPMRQRISIDESIWIMDCESYDPPYHVDPTVLSNDRMETPGGWADPEDISSISEALAAREARFRDEEGRPLNPRGRTGIAGRGLLGMWGANLSVAGVLLRTSTVTGDLEVLLGEIEDAARLELPKGFLVPDEEVEDGIIRVIESETGWRPTEPGHLLSEGYTFDARQTDHAWVESRAYLFSSEEANLPDLFEGSATFDSLGWWPLSAKTMARIPSEQAGLVRSGLEHARDAGQVDADLVDRLLARTG